MKQLLSVIATLFLLLAVINTSKSQAATFTVNKTSDTNDSACNTDCSLREAIAAANSAPTDDIINFDSSFSGNAQTIILTGNELTISHAGNLTINGTGADLLTVSGNNASRVFLIASRANVTINGITITNGNSGLGDGGGILAGGEQISTVTINNSKIINNTAGSNTTGASGGGIYITGFANLIINNSNVSNNFAGNSAGGIFSSLGTLTINNSAIRNNTARFDAGGIITSGASLGTGTFTNLATINNSTISGNTAMFQNGGGLYNRGSITIVNSTISNNSAGENGGGIYNNNLGTIKLINSTINGNRAGINGVVSAGGGVNSSNFNTNSISVRNTIIANNTSGGVPHDFRGNLTSQGYNLIETITDISFRGDLAGNITGQDPLLDPVLRNNGGPTQTHALLLGSPAINAGNNENAPAIDQRGLPRIVGGTIDIGAFEAQQSVECTYSILQQSANFPATGGTGNFNVIAPAGCAWLVQPIPAWITISPSEGTGNGVVYFTIQPNTGQARIVEIRVFDAVYKIIQAGNCSVTLSTLSVVVGAAGGTGNLNVITDAGCAWIAASSVPWININSGVTGTGSGNISFTIQPNSVGLRQGVIAVNEDRFTVLQNYVPQSQPTTISGFLIIKNTFGKPVRNAFITFKNTLTGEERIVISNPFGYASLKDIQSGQAYSITISHKQYRFNIFTVTAYNSPFSIELREAQ